MAWIKQEMDYEAERNIALDLTVKVKEEYDWQSVRMKTEDSKRKVGTSHFVSKGTISSNSCTFHVDDTCLYCVKCKLRHEGDCPRHGPLIFMDNAEAIHDDDLIKDYRSQILVIPSMLGKIPKVENMEQFGLEIFPAGKSKKGHSLKNKRKMEKRRMDAVVTDLEEMNNIIDPRLTLNETLMDPYECLSETLHVFETPNDYTSQDFNHRKLNDVFFMCEKGDQHYETDMSYKLQSSLPFRKHKPIRTMTGPFRREGGGEILNSCGNLKRVRRAQSAAHKCDGCGVRFTSVALLSTHKGVCTGEKPYKCDICGAGFCVNSSLVTHIRIHTGEKPYKCDICGASFTVNSSLISHIRTHTGEKPYKCDICGVGFTVSSGLRTHKRIHTGEKPYKCDICGSDFTCCSSLKSHKRIHTGEKPYRCDICGVGFPVNGSLKSHKRIHTGEKPYRCDICGVGFTVSTSLSSHRRIHTGEKPYRCDVCGINFTRNGHLQRHRKIHPKESPPK